jgi:hypothetical protein
MMSATSLMIQLHYITLHSLDPKLVKMTVGCGTSHTNTKTYTVHLKHSKNTYTHTQINTVNLRYVHKPLKG